MSAHSVGRGRDKGKGKARAEPTERDPLLPSTSTTPAGPYPDETRPPTRRSRIRSILSTVAIILFSLILSLALFLALLAHSFQPSRSELKELPTTAFAYSGPDNVQVLNVTDGGIFVNVSIRCGINADTALGLSSPDQGQKANATRPGARGTGARWWESLRQWSAYRVLDRLPEKAVQITTQEPIYVFPEHFDTLPLLKVTVLEPILVPLVTRVRPGTPWLQPLSFTVAVRPIASTGQLWEFVQQAWAQGEAQVVLGIAQAIAEVPADSWWAKYARTRQKDLAFELAVPGESRTHL